MTMLLDYLKRKAPLLAMLALFAAIFAAVFSLYDLPVEAVTYAVALCLAVGAALFALRFAAYVRRRRELELLRRNAEELAFTLPPPVGALEASYQELLRAVCADRARLASEKDAQYRETVDYFTLWAHQIKTPISAMELLLTEPEADPDALSAELVKVREYVEMALTYLRLDGDGSDLVLRRYSLDEIVRSTVRKYSKLFILKKINLRADETGREVLTDEKWLGFLLGQLLSNALKYTPAGGTIRIYGDGETLVVSDTGIGIRPEDLPRVFEKGFTGCNGRTDRKSTGLGLYLCRRAAKQLGCELTLTSRPGQGTLARLSIPDNRLTAE